jgi:hypothetical protein
LRAQLDWHRRKTSSLREGQRGPAHENRDRSTLSPDVSRIVPEDSHGHDDHSRTVLPHLLGTDDTVRLHGETDDARAPEDLAGSALSGTGAALANTRLMKMIQTENEILRKLIVKARILLPTALLLIIAQPLRRSRTISVFQREAFGRSLNSPKSDPPFLNIYLDPTVPKHQFCT